MGFYFGAVEASGWDGRFEQLRFRVSWWLIPGAEAILQAAPGDGVVFRVQACTNPALDLFHKVRDSITVLASRTDEGFRSLHYLEKIKEGRYRNHMGVSFSGSGRVVFTDHGAGESHSLAVPPGTLDLITAFYATREMELQVGKIYEISVVDNYRAYDLLIEVLARETRPTYFGKQTPTVIIRPLLRTKGVFKRDGAMRIWLTEDSRHLPVRVETKVSIGSIHADLIALSNDPADQVGESLFCDRR
ncbi:MAG: DUF3108 domain-containing protein [Gammaproteobacteria bacterium]